jgi:drug/metabolite transporter (DMT)-like permease
LLLLLSLCWSPSYFFIKLGVESVPPFTLVTLRVGFAALLLFLVSKGRKIPLWQWRGKAKHFFVMGLTLNALPFVLISYGEEKITSSLAAILNGTTPMFTFLLAYFFLKEDVSFKKILGLIIGFFGIVTLYLPDFLRGAFDSVLGVFLLILSSVSYAIGAVYARAYLKDLPPLVAPFWQLFASTVLLIPFVLYFDIPYTVIPTWSSMGSIGLLSLIGTALAFIVYYEIVRLEGATFVTLGPLLIPFGATLLGVLFLHEKLGWHTYVGGALVMGSLAMINPYLQKKKEVAALAEDEA